MTKTNLQIINFLGFAQSYLRKHEEKTKFRHAVERMQKRAGKVFEDYQEAMTALQIEHAATESDGGPLLTDAQGNLRFTKEGALNRNKAQKELLAKEIEIESYIATELPKESLTDAETEACSGFVIPEETEEVAREGDGTQQPQE